MKNIVLLILLSTVFLSSSCIVSFENPIAGSQSTVTDKRLLGTWSSVKKEEKGLFNFSTNSNSETILKFVNEKDQNDKIIFTVSSIQLGKYNYLSLKLVDEDNTNTFLIAKYEFVGEEMNVWLPGKEKINDLVQQGKLEGSRKDYGEISISNSSEEIKKFLESPESEELFEFFGKLKKQ